MGRGGEGRGGEGRGGEGRGKRRPNVKDSDRRMEKFEEFKKEQKGQVRSGK